jgi:hypothetical protein
MPGGGNDAARVGDAAGVGIEGVLGWAFVEAAGAGICATESTGAVGRARRPRMALDSSQITDIRPARVTATVAVRMATRALERPAPGAWGARRREEEPCGRHRSAAGCRVGAQRVRDGMAMLSSGPCEWATSPVVAWGRRVRAVASAPRARWAPTPTAARRMNVPQRSANAGLDARARTALRGLCRFYRGTLTAVPRSASGRPAR